MGAKVAPEAAKLCVDVEEPIHLLVSLRKAALDTYEYYGLGYLTLRVVYWILVVSTFFSCYSRPQIVNSASMVDQLSQFGSTEWQQRQFKSQTSMSDAASYMFDFGEALLANISASAANSAHQMAAIGEYSQLQFLRVVVDMESNCVGTAESLPCAATDGAALASALWAPMDNAPAYLYYNARTDPQRLSSAVVFSARENDTTVALDRIRELAADAEVLARYGHMLALEVVCDYSLHPGKNAWVGLTAHRSSAEQVVSVYVSTLDLYADQLTSAGTVLLMAAVLVFTAGYSGVLARSVWLYDLQRMHDWKAEGVRASGRPGEEPRRKAGWLWCLTTYLTYSLWNLLELSALCVALAWVVWYVVLLVQTRGGGFFTGADDLQSALADQHNLNQLLLWGCVTGAWYQLGALVILLTGLSLYPYFRVHPGLRLYLRVLSAAWSAILDFLVFFAFIFLLIGMFCLATTQLPGVQPDLTYPSTAFSALAKLMMGFYSYDEFVNSDVPKTALLTIVQDAVFWIAVIMLFVLVQNILLAIVAVAYDEANLLEGTADASFVFVVIIRLTWYAVYAYYRLWRRMRWIQIVIALDQWPTSTFSLYYKRWAIACTSEAQALQGYYTFFLNWHFKLRSPWLRDPFKSRPKHPSNPAEETPPHSIDAPLTQDQLLASLRTLGATPSFQRLCALTWPWPLHRVRAYRWHEASCEELAAMVWRCYSFNPADMLGPGGHGAEGGGGWRYGQQQQGSGPGGGGRGRWYFRSALKGAQSAAAWGQDAVSNRVKRGSGDDVGAGCGGSGDGGKTGRQDSCAGDGLDGHATQQLGSASDGPVGNTGDGSGWLPHTAAEVAGTRAEMKDDDMV